MKAPTVVHEATTTTEYAVLCSDGRVHYDNAYCQHQDREEVRAIADKVAARGLTTWCGGNPHTLCSRKRIVTAWEPVAPASAQEAS